MKRSCALLLIAAMLAGCGTRTPWISSKQLASLSGPTVQVIVAQSDVTIEYEPSAGRQRAIGVGAGVSSLAAAVPIAGIFVAMAVGAAGAAVNNCIERNQQAQSRSAAYQTSVPDYDLQHQLDSAMQKALATSPAYRNASYLPSTRNVLKGNPRDSGSAQTTVEASAHVSDDEDAAVVHALVQIASPDRTKLWHTNPYRSAVYLADLIGPTLTPELRGKDSETRRRIRQDHWTQDNAALLRKALDMAVRDVSAQIAYDLGAPWPADTNE